MKVISVHCTGTLVRCTGDVKTRSALCGRFYVLSHDFEGRPSLHVTLRGPVLAVHRGLALVYATTIKSTPTNHRFTHFVALILGGQQRGFLRCVYLDFLSLCQGSGRVNMKGLVATIPIDRRIQRHVRSDTSSLLRTDVRLRARISPSVRNNFVFSVGSFHLSTDVTARLGGIGRRFVSGGEEVI